MVDDSGATGERGGGARRGQRAPSPVRALVIALDRLLDEGITDYSARTRENRRRMAALYAGFVEAEALLTALGSRRARRLPSAEETVELVRVTRHVVYWAEVNATIDPSPETRAALAGVHQALRAATGDDCGAHLPALLDCERCGAPGAELALPGARDALCGLCATGARRFGTL